MRRNQRLYKPLVLLLIALMLCSTVVAQTDIRPARADDGNLADKAVVFLKTEYQDNGAQGGYGGIGPFDAYVLKSAGVDVSEWEYNDESLSDAVTDLVDQDIDDDAASVKHLAQDLIAMQELGDDDLVDQLKTILHNRQNDDGSFQDDASVYSIIPAYELLGRAGQLGVVDAVYAQNYILGQQDTSTGAWPDFMGTAQAVRALNYLAPGAAPDSEVGQAITSGCNWLRQQQKSDGSFQAAMDDPLIDTAEAIATQKALGLDPAVDWTTGGKSAVDYLNNNSLNDDGSFGSSRNVMDATWALDSFVLLGILPTGGGGGGGGDPPASASVRVRVEGITGAPADSTVSVSGTALDALNQAVGSDNVVAPGGYITSINGESGDFAGDPPTSWLYYVIRDGEIDPISLSSVPSGYTVSNGDQVVFYIGAYDAVSYANLTYLPVVSISPQEPTAGQDITFSISAQKYDWSTGLQGLSVAEVAAIGDYTLTAGGTTYTSSSGQVTIPDAAEGDLIYVITNQNDAGYPDVVPYRGSVSVGPASSGGGSTTTCTPRIAVVGMSGEILFGPSTVTVLSTNPWGLTAMGALDATGLSYTTSSTWDGYVDSIDGQASSGMKGWMYTVNGDAPMVLAKDYAVSSGDKVIWYYSNSMDQEAPTWEQLSSGEQTTTTSSGIVTSTTGKATVIPAAGGTVGLGGEASIIIPADALSGTAGVDIAIQRVSSPQAVPDGFRLLGSVFEFTVGGSTSYRFNHPVTLSFSFDVSALPEGEMPSVFYYDAGSAKWVDLGGTVDGSIITVSVDHLTKFALLIKDVEPPLAPAQSFTDVPESFWASDAIINLNLLGYVNGYPDGTFKPDNQVTRAEFVSILDKVLKLPGYSPAAPDFSDVFSQDWFYGAVENAVHAGIIKGYGSTFNPDQQVTREELAVIMVNALGGNEEAMASMNEKTSFSDDAGISGWARGFVVVAVKKGLIKGYPDGGFNPQGSATRAEACVIITNFLNLKESMK
ncbi:MAG: DUF4430 domain-containing protein [Firmicutes bacterium]|nr:DUF4430 domain-containing protein [Bacillota bacterium]